MTPEQKKQYEYLKKLTKANPLANYNLGAFGFLFDIIETQIAKETQANGKDSNSQRK